MTKLILYFAIGLISQTSWAVSKLTMMLVQRPPYLIMKDGNVSGLSVAPTVAAFKKANTSVNWEEIPAKRQIQRLKKNQERVCSVGWYQTEERKKFAKFTNAVSQDSPWVGLVPATSKISKNATIEEILSDPKIRVLLKEGFVYGDYIDKKMVDMKAQTSMTTVNIELMIKMIAVAHADIAFFTKEEIMHYIDTGIIKAKDVQILSLKNMPSGYSRHLMCSKMVEDEVITKFNDALKK